MTALDPLAVRRTWIFLGAIAAVESLVLLAQSRVLAQALALHAPGSAFGWLLAAVVAALTMLYSIRALDLMPYMTNVSWFRLLGPIVAIPSALLEEAVFRLTVMNLLAHAHQGAVVQVAGSALSFGVVHAVWAVRGGRRSLVTAVSSMTLLGALLAIVFLASGRALLPCVAAHFVINLVLEPWLGYAYALRMQGQRVDRGTVYSAV